MVFVLLYLRYLVDYMGAELALTREIGARLQLLLR
jgi:hypothetical protein